MKNWKKLYIRCNTTNVSWTGKEDLDFIKYLEEENIVWRNPVQAEMPYIINHWRYMLHVDPEELVFLKLKFGI